VSRSLKAHILLVLITLVWGATFVLIKDALAHISPLLFNAVRLTLAAVTLLLVFRKDLSSSAASRQAGFCRRVLINGSAVGVLLWLGLELQTSGLRLTTPSKSAFITGVSVVLVPIFLAFGWRRTVNRWTALGVLAAFAGLYLLAVPASAVDGLDLSSINRGDLLTFGCAAAFALQIIMTGRATARYPFQQIVTVEAVVCALLMLVTAPLAEHIHAVWSASVIWGVLITGLAGTGAAFAIQAWAQQFTPPTHTALIFSLEPVFAAITSYLILGERLGSRGLLGAAMILGGVLISELKAATASPARAEADWAESAD
jgi:drug/metabolite transporter (DMT)-like permease